MTDIADKAFYALPALTSITFKGSNPPEVLANVFKAPNENVSVYVPANSIEDYKTKLGGLSSKVKGAIILADDEAYTRESDAEGVAAFYTRNFTNVNWQALYLPFSLKYEDWKDDFDMAYINVIIQRDNDDDGEIDKTELEIIKMFVSSTPILILDDVFSELDKTRRLSLVSAMKGAQIFITCTDKNMIGEEIDVMQGADKAEFYRVNGGDITREA